MVEVGWDSAVELLEAKPCSRSPGAKPQDTLEYLHPAVSATSLPCLTLLYLDVCST